MEGRKITPYAYKRAAGLFTITAFVVLCAYINVFGVCDTDEMYKFAASRALAKGYKMYSEVNLVETPLYFVLMSLPLKISDTFLMYRVMSAVMYGCASYLIYQIIKDDAKIPTFTTLMLTLFLFSVNPVAGHNLLVHILLLLVMYIYKVNGLTDKALLSIGFLVALIVLTRQTTGILAAVAFTVYFIYREVERKTYIKYFLMPIILMSLLFVLNMGIIGVLPAFYDQCIAGLSQFTDNTEIYVEPLVIVMALAVSVVALIKVKKEDTGVFFPISATALSIGIPIADKDHLIYSAVISVMVITMAFGAFAEAGHLTERDDRYLKVTLTIAIILAITIPLGRVLISIHEKGYVTEGPFIGMHETTLSTWAADLHEKIKKNHNDDDYIVISRNAATLSIYGETYQKEYDIFLTGNIGTRKPEDIIDATLKEGKKVIIDDGYGNTLMQHFTGLQDYLRKNHVKTAAYTDNKGAVYEVFKE